MKKRIETQITLYFDVIGYLVAIYIFFKILVKERKICKCKF